ncbi:MAG: radical SAM protein [Deltaproteobacteria bacterium]|nr:radical SAM protein [Deltaproteobacteria bacterium]
MKRPEASDNLTPDVGDNNMYSFPIQIAWEVTGKCNLNCLYCLNESGRTKTDLPEEKLKSFLDDILKNKVLDVIISGGEPLLLPSIFEILETLKSNNVRVTLLTNGTLLDKKRCGRLKGLVDEIQISLDTLDTAAQEILTGVKGSHSTIMRGIDASIEAELPLSLGAVINRLNYRGMHILAEFCLKKGVKHLSISEMMKEGRALLNFNMLGIGKKERVEAFSDLEPYKDRLKITGHEPSLAFLIGGKKDNKCDCSLVSCAVACNGDVLPCSYIREKAGSICEMPLKEIWNASFEKHRNAVSLPAGGTCNGCNKLSICNGGCKGLAWSYTGKMESANPICIYKDRL